MAEIIPIIVIFKIHTKIFENMETEELPLLFNRI